MTYRFSLLLLCCGWLWPVSAWAYLDPGTGSMILQGLLAGIAVAGATAKLYWHKILAFFGKAEDIQPVEQGDEPGNE